jgi:hypothetical protein
MTNIIEKTTKTDMQTHIDMAYEIIKDSLPSDYTSRVHEKLNDKSVSDGVIRNVKNRISNYPFTRIAVLNALVEVAQEYQLEAQKLKSNVLK